MELKLPITACKQYCLAAGATQGNIAYTQNVKGKLEPKLPNGYTIKKNKK
jgi:hypothetical protein